MSAVAAGRSSIAVSLEGSSEGSAVAAAGAEQIESLVSDNERLRKALAQAEEAAGEAAAEMERVQQEYLLLAEAVSAAGAAQSASDEEE